MAKRKSSGTQSKLFVLDTNVILHDAQSLHAFQEHDIAIPITVLEELDKFKKGQGDINFQAREFLRTLDELTGDLLSDKGVSLGAGRGNIRVVIPRLQDQRIREAFLRDEPDHRILNAALQLTESESDRMVVLVSKDTNIRMKAKSLGIIAQDFIRDRLESVDALYKGKRTIEADDATVDLFYADTHQLGHRSHASKTRSPTRTSSLRDQPSRCLRPTTRQRSLTSASTKRSVLASHLGMPSSPSRCMPCSILPSSW